MSEVMEKPAEVISTALVTMQPEKYVATLYTPLNVKLADAIAAADKIVIDCRSTAGYAVAVKQRALFRDDLRLAAESARVECKAPILEVGQLIDSKSKEIQAKAKEYELKFDAAIKAEDARKQAEKDAKIAAERARTDGIKSRINELARTPLIVVGQSSVAIDRVIQSFMAEVLDESYEEFLSEAQAAHATALAALQSAVGAAIQSEQEAARIIAERESIAAAQAAESNRLKAERAELARLTDQIAEQERKAKAQRQADDAAAAEVRRKADETAAEQRRQADASLAARSAELQRQQDEINERNRIAAVAEQERLDAIHEEQEALARAERAEADRIAHAAAQQAAADEAERARVADEDHRSTINASVALAFSEAGFSPELAWKAMVAIADGKIPHVSITY